MMDYKGHDISYPLQSKPSYDSIVDTCRSVLLPLKNRHELRNPDMDEQYKNRLA